MNQDLKSKIRLISEIISLYQTTVMNETDSENIKLMEKDIANKRLELENIKNELNIELNKLYENGANEIDQEVNQMQIAINDVNDLLEDIIPDILSYVQSPNFEIKKVPVELKVENKIVISELVGEQKAEPIKIENEIQLSEPAQNQEDNISNENNLESILEEIDDLEGTDEFESKQITEKIKIDEEIKQNKVFVETPKKQNCINTIKLKQPTEDYRNTASNIVLNRIKNVDSPESAIQKSFNAAESVMNNIIENLSETNRGM